MHQFRHGINSNPKLELMANSNSGIRIAYLKKRIGIDKFCIGIEVCYKTIKKKTTALDYLFMMMSL